MILVLRKSTVSRVCILACVLMEVIFSCLSRETASIFYEYYFSQFYSLYMIPVVMIHQAVPLSALKKNGSAMRMKGWRQVLNRNYLYALCISLLYSLAGILNIVIVQHGFPYSIDQAFRNFSEILLWTCFFTSAAHFLLRITGQWMISGAIAAALAVLANAINLQMPVSKSFYSTAILPAVIVLTLFTLITLRTEPNERIAGGQNE